MSNHELSPVAIVEASDCVVTWSSLLDLLQAERLFRQHEREIARTRLPVLRAMDGGAPSAMRAEHDRACREALVGMLAAAAIAPVLQATHDALDLALSAKPDESVVEACLGILIDTRVKLPHNLPAYLEALIFDLLDEGFPPAIVASACQRIRRESVFLPEISEVLATCRETLERYHAQRRRVSDAIEARRQADLWLAEMVSAAEHPNVCHERQGEPAS